MESIIVLKASELDAAIIRALEKFHIDKEKKLNPKSLTINQVAKILGRSNATIKKYVENGLLISTKDGRILETEIEAFLQRKK